MKIVKELHDASSGFAPKGKVICHNDLSPCNTVFRNDVPVAIIDWDSAAFGERWEDLTYILWLWINKLIISSQSKNVLQNCFDNLSVSLAIISSTFTLSDSIENSCFFKFLAISFSDIKFNDSSFSKMNRIRHNYSYDSSSDVLIFVTMPSDIDFYI